MPAEKMNLSLVILLCAVAATLAVVFGAVGARRQMHRSIENTHLTRFHESGEAVASTIAGVAEQYLGDPGRHQIELAALVNAVRTMDDSLGVSITGRGEAQRSASFEHVWASSEQRFRGPDGVSIFSSGETIIDDELSREVGRVRAAVNLEGERELAELGAQIRQVSAQILQLLTEGGADREAEIAEMDAVFRILYLRATERLAAVGARHSGSIPAEPLRSDSDVVFYHPVVVFDQSADGWYAGMVRFRRSTDLLQDAVRNEQQTTDASVVRLGLLLLAGLWVFFLLLFLAVRR